MAKTRTKRVKDLLYGLSELDQMILEKVDDEIKKMDEAELLDFLEILEKWRAEKGRWRVYEWNVWTIEASYRLDSRKGE